MRKAQLKKGLLHPGFRITTGIYKNVSKKNNKTLKESVLRQQCQILNFSQDKIGYIYKKVIISKSEL